ncbi:antiviral reverse transcriptase Drt3a [Tenacibaculum finnmarkense]|uniref:antiviral reverse transcriptase Drt3a n=1 Tax=Tenacibaculum finnmarkense TaxID=2781243 RepID=UPI001EFB652C|nr:antiviral reverse transcriptase Drt3a [Tenacibaculum finnmarkense]MCG8733176.1 RNA-directed DNA polymerase [Tenacibaculum finnmarkense]
MLDQSFSSTNFNKLFLKENRKGNFDKSHLNTEYFNKQEEFKNVLREKRELKKNKTLSSEKLDEFAERLENINNEKEEIRLSVFEEYSDKINNQDDPFQFKIEYNLVKEVYTVGKDPASYYAVKQLQQNINKTFKVIQADRNKIIKQIFNIASDGFPKIIIKTDIKSFYESIPQDRLFKKIENNTLLSPFSKKLIKRLFYEFEDKKDKTKIPLKKGIPRGIGISAYLSELYMRDIDNEIKELEDVIYYARYVDDIIVIVCPKTVSKKRDYLNEIRAIVSKNLLELKDGTDGKETKTQEIELFQDKIRGRKDSDLDEFKYLGYKFILKHFPRNAKTELTIEISDNKIKEKYINRLDAIVKAYNNDSKYNEKEARNIMFSRLKFLTGNFHLNNNKRNIKSGVFYSNRMLELNHNNFESLNTLNSELNKKIKTLSPPKGIKNKKDNFKEKLINHILSNYDFKKGFENKEKFFYTFSFNSKEASFYSKKFKRVTNKFEVIKSIWK